MKKIIALLALLALITGMMTFANPGTDVQAQGLSFPAEINKSFTPISIEAGGISRLRVTVYNPNSFELTNTSWTDNLVGVQPGLLIANPANISNTCGGSVTATPGTTTLSLSGGTVPLQVGSTPGECTVEIDVTSTTPGNLINTIPANEVSATGEGGISITNTTPASATLTVIGVQPPNVNKFFSPNTMFVGETSVLTIIIDNTDSSSDLSGTSLTDNLPANVVIANPPMPANALQNCGASAELIAAPGASSITLNNATVTPSLNCIVRVNVTSLTSGIYTNTIPASVITTQQGVTNPSSTSDQLNVQAVGVEKAFSPSAFQAGDISTLTIILQNPTGVAYTGVSIFDTLPGTVLSVVSGSAITTCGGTASTTLPRTVTLIDGTIPAGSVTDPGTCTLSVQVTAPTGADSASFINIIPPDTLITDQGVSNVLPATAPIRIYADSTGIEARKVFNASSINAGDNSRLRINMRAPADTALTNFSLTDNLPAGVVISNSSAPFVSPNCGPTATLTVVTGTSVISLTNAIIEAGVQCFIDVWVTSDIAGDYLNVITPADITNDQNRVPDSDIVDNLTVLGLSDLSVNKVFSPNTVVPNGISTLTITLENTNDLPLVDVSLTDNLPGITLNDALFVAPVPNVSTTCAGGVVTATPGSQMIQMIGGTVPAQVGEIPGICTINVDVQGSNTPGDRNNTIPTTNVSGTIEGTTTIINPGQDASATLFVQDLSIGIVKGFDPLTVFGGSASTMSVQLINPNSTDLVGVGFTDTMPSGMFLATPPNLDTGSCGGVLSGTPGSGSFTFSGGFLPANTSCTLTLSITMNVNGNLTNVIPVNAVTTFNGATNPDPAEASLTNLAGASISKFFSPNPIAAGEFSLLTITIVNTANVPLSGMGLIDNLPGILPAGVEIAGAPAPAPTNTCGGTLAAETGTQDIELTNGTLSASSSCTIVVAVTGTVPGDYQNIIPIGALTSNEGATNTQPAIDTLTITGLSELAALGDFVWNDLNADGIQDVGEAGIAGVTVRLLDENGNELATTVTDANGFYSFTDLPPGTYRVDFEPPVGYTVSPQDQGANDAVDSDADVTTGETANVTLGAGETNNTLDAGLYQLAALGDYVWNDLNADGIQDAGEAGIAGVTVRLLDENGNELATTTTDANGFYSFTDLTPGTYQVDFIPPAGFVFSPQDQGGDDATDSDADPTTGETTTTTLISGENDLTWDAGLYQPASLGDYVWNDLNADGIQDAGETGIDGVTVDLYRPGYGPDGIPGNGDDADIVATDITSGGGLYLFDNLPPGDYYVDFTPPFGYVISPQDQGGDDAADSDADPTTGETVTTTLVAGENDLTWDAGMYQPPELAALGDFVWNDLNADGIQDAGETGIPGVTVRLLDENGNELATTTTDANGFYSFTNLAPGTYRIDFEPPAGYTVSPQNQGTDDAVDSDADVTTGETANVTLAAGETNNTLDAGLYQLAALGDFVWSDDNADGIQDAGEAGVAGVTVRLLDENGNELATTTTDVNGFYSFTDLTPGTYRVDFLPPAGYGISPADQGADDAVDSDADPTTGETANVTLVAGETNNTLDAGLHPLAALGDFVWIDLDTDGIQDAGEIGIADVTVRLLDESGNELATTTTDANGFYSFTDLIPGTYRVDFLPPPGYTISPANQGADDSADSDADTSTGETANVTLTPGETNNTLDAGLYLQTPAIQVDKTISAVNFVNPDVVQITYSILVLNTGNVTLSNIQVTDDLNATFPAPASFNIVSLLSGAFSVNTNFDGDADIDLLTGSDTLATGASGVITLVVLVDSGGEDTAFVNTADASGISPSEQEVTDSSSVPGPSFIDPALTKSVDPALASVGDLVTFTITVTNNGNVPAAGVVVTDPLPANLDIEDVTSIDATSSPRGTISIIPPRTVQVDLGTVDINDVITITILTRVNSRGQPPVENEATLTAAAPPQGVSPDPLPNNISVVRLQIAGPTDDDDGDNGGGGGGRTGLTGFIIPVTGFAPDRVTDLSGLPVTKYNAMDEVTLEVPVLKLDMPIVGIPKKGNTWDVNWLLNQAGWLEGSAFPGFSGNSILTSHVTLPYGQAGPFANLHKLKAGDKIFVHAFGNLYIYEIRSVRTLNATDPSIVQHEDKSWLTLVTCADYNENVDTYLKRVVVKAEFIQAQPERWWSDWR